MSIETPSAPALATVAGVELGSVGYWDISNIVGWHPTADDMAAAVAALDCPAVRRPVLKFGHTGEPGEGDPAIGIIDNLRLTDDGQTLVGDFVGVPAWLATADAEGRSVIASAYPDRSGEWAHNYVCQLGHTHPFVLHAMALLGVMRPGIGTLESLYDLYTKAPEMEEVAMAGIPVALAGTTTDEVRKAYYNGPAAADYSLWIREMYVEPPELIVQDDKDDTLLRVTYSVTASGDIEFADGQAVKVEYVAARAKVEKPALAFASRAEARTTPETPSAASGEVDNGEEPTVATLNEGLAELFGLEADASDEAILEAVQTLKIGGGTGEGEAPAAEPTTEQIAARAKALGLTLVDSEQYQNTIAQAQQGAEARAQQLREADERTVDFAISKGRIPVARRDHHLQALSADRSGHKAVLDALPDGLIPLAEVGHANEPAEGTAPDDLSWFDTAESEPSNEREDA